MHTLLTLQPMIVGVPLTEHKKTPVVSAIKIVGFLVWWLSVPAGPAA